MKIQTVKKVSDLTFLNNCFDIISSNSRSKLLGFEPKVRYLILVSQCDAVHEIKMETN